MGLAIDRQHLLGRDREVRNLSPLLETGGGGRIGVIGNGQSRAGQGIEAQGEALQGGEDGPAMGKGRNKLRVSYQQSSIH
jgi:hypothetical protein